MKIWKFPLTAAMIKMPMAPMPLSVGLDPDGVPCIWCAVQEMNPGRWYEVVVVVTGGELPPFNFVGTFVKDGFVGHVFFNPLYNLQP